MKSVHVWVYEDQAERLKTLARREERSMSWMVRHAIKTLLENDLNNQWCATADNGADRAVEHAPNP